MGEGREEDTTEERREGEREQRFHLKVTGRGVGGSEVAICQRCVGVLPKRCLQHNCMCK